MRGFSFIDVIVGIALMLIVFLGIFGAYHLGLKVVNQSKNKITALAIAEQQIELIRNLSYLDVGTKNAVLPFASGILDSSTTTTRNNVEYTIALKIKFISDPADGVGADDICDLDYKRTEVTVSWQGRFGSEVQLVTDIAPKSKTEEAAACFEQPGGILSVSVFDAFGEMVSSPLIEIYNAETEAWIDDFTPSSGKHDFPLATSTYKVIVSKSGCNFARSYGTDEISSPGNRCYARPHQIVSEGQLIPVSFCIDETSAFSVNTFSPWGLSSFSDSFIDASKISELSDVIVNNGEIILATTTQGYVNFGYVISLPVTPVNLLNWDEFSFTDSEPYNTDLKYQIYYASGTDWYFIPESDLPGNLQGFDISPIDLSMLAPATFSQLKLLANASTSVTSSTPTFYDWQISWITSEATPIPNVAFSLQGKKGIGYNGENMVYKYSASHTSDFNSHIDITDLEWDSYTFSIDPITGLDLVDIEPLPHPISLLPNNQNISVNLYLAAENSLLITMENIETLNPIFGATTTAYNIGLGYENTQHTNAKGQVYFIPLETATYNLEIAALGYLATSTSILVSGDVTKTIKLRQIE